MSYRLTAALWVIFLLPVVNAQEGSGRQEAYSLLQQQQFKEAEAALRPLLAKAPNDCVLHAMLGIALQGEGETAQAYTTFDSAAKICPRSLPILEGAAQIAYAQHKLAAKIFLNRILELRPADPTAHAMLAAIEVHEGNCSAAVDDYGKSGAQIASNMPALREYASCLVVVDQKAEAIRILTQAISLQDKAETRLMLARVQNDSGNRGEALTTLLPLLAGPSPMNAALLLAAQIAEADSNTPQAVAWLRQAIQLDSKNEEDYVYFAEISFTHGSYQVGIDLVNVGLRELPGNARLLLARGVLEVQVGKLDSALADFEEAHRADPKLSFVEDAMGVLFSQKHDTADALALFAKRLKDQPNDPLLQYLYAEALSEGTADNREITEKAITAVKKAILLEPGYTPARELDCVLLLRAGDLQGVIQQAEEVTKRDPYNEAALYQELLAERKLKHPEETQRLVVRLQDAKRHNHAALTKYMLQEGPAAPASVEP